MLTKLPEPKPLEAAPVDSEEYIRVIWDAHCERRASEFPLMSSAEFGLALSWYLDKIPLCVVLRGFQDTLRSGSRLTYYKSSVDQAFKMWRHAMLGSDPSIYETPI